MEILAKFKTVFKDYPEDKEKIMTTIQKLVGGCNKCRPTFILQFSDGLAESEFCRIMWIFYLKH